MFGKKRFFSTIAGVVVVAAMSFGVTQAFATPAKAGFAPGCVEHPSCPYGNAGSWGLLRCCDPM